MRIAATEIQNEILERSSLESVRFDSSSAARPLSEILYAVDVKPMITGDTSQRSTRDRHRSGS